MLTNGICSDFLSNVFLCHKTSSKVTAASTPPVHHTDCAYAQADLSLCWSHIPHCWKAHVAAQMVLQCVDEYMRRLHMEESGVRFHHSNSSLKKEVILNNVASTYVDE